MSERQGIFALCAVLALVFNSSTMSGEARVVSPSLIAARQETTSLLLPLPESAARRLRPDYTRAVVKRSRAKGSAERANAYVPRRPRNAQPLKRPALAATDAVPRLNAGPPAAASGGGARPAPISARARFGAAQSSAAGSKHVTRSPLPASPLTTGTPLSRVLHLSQLSLTNASGTIEQFFDRDRNLVADERTTFETNGGAFDIAVGRSGARYEVLTAIDDRGTRRTDDDLRIGLLVVALDTNADFVADSFQTYDLGRDFRLPSAVSVASGTSRHGREFVVISSSGYFNFADSSDPANEASPGVVLLVRDQTGAGFDAARSRSLVSVGDNRLFNANAVTLLLSGHLVVADFHSNELRIIRDTDGDLVPDTLDPVPFYDFPFTAGAADAPLDIAANSRGVVFSHSAGNDTRLLALSDTNSDGYADDEFDAVVGLSIDDNLVLHGLTVARDGTVFLIQDALGESDLARDGGNGGIPHVQAFPDPALNGLLRDGSIFVLADDEFTQAYSGLSFGIDVALGPVGRLTLTNSASLRGEAPAGGLGTISGVGLTRGRRGATQVEAAARGVRVTIEGAFVPILSFDDTRVHIHIPPGFGAGLGSVVVSVDGEVTAADDAALVPSNPGLFTVTGSGTGEAIALLVSGNRYTSAPFPASFDGRPAVVALLGTGWRQARPVRVRIAGRPATVEYAGAAGGFHGLDQINVVIPAGLAGQVDVSIETADGRTSRPGVFITIQ
jgi:uncharacterized protein (TIGR03437 family)